MHGSSYSRSRVPVWFEAHRFSYLTLRSSTSLAKLISCLCLPTTSEHIRDRPSANMRCLGSRNYLRRLAEGTITCRGNSPKPDTLIRQIPAGCPPDYETGYKSRWCVGCIIYRRPATKEIDTRDVQQRVWTGIKGSNRERPEADKGANPAAGQTRESQRGRSERRRKKLSIMTSTQFLNGIH